MFLEPICPQLIKSRLEIVEDNGIAETLEDKGQLYLLASNLTATIEYFRRRRK